MDITRLSTGRRTAAAVAVTALGALAPWVPAPAHATSEDPTGDVVVRGVEDDSQTPDPDWDNGDIVATTPSYRGREVVVKVSFADLRKDVDSFTHELRIKTRRHEFQVLGFANEEKWRGRFFMFRDGEQVRCSGLGHGIFYGMNELVVVVPRACLGRPAWVRVGWRTESWVDAAETTRADDASRDGSVGELPRLGPRMPHERDEKSSKAPGGWSGAFG